ncbi:sensor histidine kinase [Candidatus Odyssella thessalonicensis]|uniref:sensor histidine kinase n=1 Tax=Candidatus Odyssella thessalonicensis TaxID=84647 RepID=UPI000527FC49|nr:PAS domain-containing sensor histidine kinase [Candidatus Odyssella thessalonicensis]
MTVNNPFSFKIVNYSKKLLELLEYSEEELLSIKSMHGLYHLDCYEALDQLRISYLKQGSAYGVELFLKTRNNKKVPIHLDLQPLKDRHGNIICNHALYKLVSQQGIDSDSEFIKEQHHLESLNNSFIEVQSFYAYFSEFYENAPDMLMSAAGRDDDTENVRITNCNNTLAQTLGYTKEEIINMKVYDLYPPSALQEVQRMRQHLLCHDHVNNWELTLQKKNGEQLPTALSARIIRDGKGEFYSIGMWRDITDLVEARRQLQTTNSLLREQNEEVKTLMHLMSHDVQAPIRAVEIYTQLVLEETKDILPEPALEYLHKVQKSARRLYHLTCNILSYFFSGASESQEETCLEEIINHAKPYMELPAATQIILKDNIHSFKTKKTLLSQIFYNLVSNAVKYHHNLEAAEICIEGTDSGKYWLFSVKDNGPGIAPRFHETVFEPMKRLNTGKSGVEGSGMGLAIVKKLITQEGGWIELESNEGKGAQFIFTWPKS